MAGWIREAEALLRERFGRDNILALATVENGRPQVRYVNAYYENGAFYAITHGLSNKMRQLRENPGARISAISAGRRMPSSPQGCAWRSPRGSTTGTTISAMRTPASCAFV